MKIGVFAGSFCPITRGHVDVIAKSAKLVDKLFVAVGVNGNKKYAIPLAARTEMAKNALKGFENVTVVAHEGMMTDFCKHNNVDVMIKSIRNVTDLQSVIDLADVNEMFWDGETVFIVGDKQYRYVSSSLVRELADLGQDFSGLVPKCCYEEIKKYLIR